MNITLIDKCNFSRKDLDSFSRYQEVEFVYRMADGDLRSVYHPFTETWSPEQKDEKARKILDGKHIVYGAFENGRIVGILMLLPGLNRGRMIIDSFHVSAEMRRHGIGRALLAAAKEKAASCGADALYVSACSSRETVDFYMAMGFRVSLHPIQSRVNDEPYDIQMECAL